MNPDLFEYVPERSIRVKSGEQYPAHVLLDIDVGRNQQVIFVFVIDIEGGRGNAGFLGNLGNRTGGKTDFVDYFYRSFKQGCLFLIVSRTRCN